MRARILSLPSEVIVNQTLQFPKSAETPAFTHTTTCRARCRAPFAFPILPIFFDTLRRLGSNALRTRPPAPSDRKCKPVWAKAKQGCAGISVADSQSGHHSAKSVPVLHYFAPASGPPNRTFPENERHAVRARQPKHAKPRDLC